jgi:hypothetical protein
LWDSDVNSDSTDDYLAENRRLAALLPGSHIETLTRLTAEPVDDEPRLEWGPAVLTSADGLQWLIDCEESRSNILLLDPKAGGQLSRSWYGGFTERTAIADPSIGNPLHLLLKSPIASVEKISREPSPSPGLPSSFAMCGLRLTTADGFQVCVGTHLTDLIFTQVAFLLPDETDPDLTYSEL